MSLREEEEKKGGGGMEVTQFNMSRTKVEVENVNLGISNAFRSLHSSN